MHWAAVTAHLSQLLTVSIHQILFERRVYPATSFLDARIYNFPVKQNRHPGVCAWIQAAVAAALQQIALGAVARVVLALAHAETYDVLERYVFDVERLPAIAPEDVDAPMVREDEPPDPRGPGGALEHEMADLTEQLRGSLATMCSLSQRLEPIPRGCTFTLAVELRDHADAPVGHPQPWIPAAPGKRLSSVRSADSDSYNGSDPKLSDSLQGGRRQPRTVPLRAIDAEGLLMEIWAEEGASKDALDNHDSLASSA